MAKKATAFTSPAQACHNRKAAAVAKAAAKRAKAKEEPETEAETRGAAEPSRVRAAKAAAETGSSN